MTILRLFAVAREAAGVASVEMEQGSVAQVLAAATDRFGARFGDLLASCTVVVDDEMVLRSEFETRGSGSEMAVLPPVSGGSGKLEDSHHDGPHVPAGRTPELRVALVTVSDRASRGDYEDRTGPEVELFLTRRLGALVVDRSVVADDRAAIAAKISDLCDSGAIDLVLTAGGTGVGCRDVTPEATRDVLEVEAPGIAELMRSVGLTHTPLAALSRQVAGRRGRTMVVNLPGSPKGAVESLEAVAEILGHACAVAGNR